jgi:antitoxin PrlF
VRKALRVEKRDKIHYSLLADGRVVLSVVKQPESDPVIEKFLSLLAKDIASNPHHTHSVSVDVFNRVQSLIAGVEVNIDAPLSEEDE